MALIQKRIVMGNQPSNELNRKALECAQEVVQKFDYETGFVEDVIRKKADLKYPDKLFVEGLKAEPDHILNEEEYYKFINSSVEPGKMETWGQALFGFDGNNAKWRIKTKMLYSILEDLDDQKGVSALDLAALFQGIEGKSSQDEFNQFIQFNLTPAPRAYIQNIYDYLHPFGEQIKNSLKPKH